VTDVEHGKRSGLTEGDGFNFEASIALYEMILGRPVTEAERARARAHWD